MRSTMRVLREISSLARLLTTALGVALYFVPAPVIFAAADAPEHLTRWTAERERAQGEKLKAVWTGYESEVTTAEIDYDSLLFSCDQRVVSPQEFRDELQQLDLASVPDLALTVVKQFCPERLEGTPQEVQARLKAVVDRRRFLLQGNQRRCVSHVAEHVLTDDLHLMVEESNRNIKAFRRGKCPYWFETLPWFRTIPNDTLLGPASQMYDGPGALHLYYTDAPVASGSWVALDRHDGLPRYWELRSPQTGQLRRMEFYRDYTTYPGDVLFPAVRVEANVREDRITTVQMSVIRSARFNISLEDSAFRLAGPAGWVWFDWQTEDRQSGRWKKPVDDVAAFFKARSASPPGTDRLKSSGALPVGWKSLLLILNGTLLIVVGVALWRRSP